MNEQLRQHLDMFLSSLENSAFTDNDRVDLFELLLQQTHRSETKAILPAILKFSASKPALYADLVRQKLASNKESAVHLLLKLLKQLDDPVVPDEAIDRSIRAAVDEARMDSTYINLALVLPMVFDLRREVMSETALDMTFETLEESLREIFGYDGSKPKDP